MRIFLYLIFLSLLWSGNSFQPSSPQFLFEKVSAKRSSINFVNKLKETEKENMISFTNFYSGSGVGILDVNNDGLQDIFFGGNQVSSRLYLNRGGLRFEDITEKAGVITDRWVTGVSIVDLNQDGFDDIYLSVSGSESNGRTENLLFINNRKNGFTEKGAEYNLNEKEQTDHTSFFDYDRDGDLDAFMATNPTDFKLNSPSPLTSPRIHGEARSTDKLYRNEGNGKFKDVSKEAGILIEGYSLGVCTCDFNNDGWIDIYVTNDYINNDILYINNGNGTFSNKSKEYFSHTCFASMGNDAGDINNDGLIDLFVADMLPESSYKRKTHVLTPGFTAMQNAYQLGYEAQFSRNILQLNNGNNTFSDIGQMAGVDQSDWSWAPLLSDLDNDGDKDLFITTGFRRDMGNLDYVFFEEASPFKMKQTETSVDLQLESIKSRDGILIDNFVFRNNNDLTFTKTTGEWGLADPSYSSGAAVADLDNDGDNDIIINNIDQKAAIFENKSDKILSNHYLKIKLLGSRGNISGIGSKITIYYNGNMQFIENNVYRGYESSCEKNILFGTGKFTVVDSVEVIWPEGLRSILTGIRVDTTIILKHQSASQLINEKSRNNNKANIFSEITSKLGIKYLHCEDSYSDFYDQPLLPNQLSQLGPCIAVGDINGDQLEDFYVGGARGFSGTLFFQRTNGTFRAEKFPFDEDYEDLGALLFDFDGDKDLDLYVVSGGTYPRYNSVLYLDRLYINIGKGRFSKSDGILPEIRSSGGCVTAVDFDKDNDLDLFVGGRVSPRQYPVPPRSFLLENTGKRFIDITKDKAPGLESLGMVTSALWSDITGDGNRDLIIVGEWLPITIYVNQSGHFVNKTKEFGLDNTVGWWNSINAGDVNNDGKTDYMLGNLGLNTGYRASISNPLKIIAKDFNNDGITDPILVMKFADGFFPTVTRNEFLKVFPLKSTKYNTYSKYAAATAEDILKDLGVKDAIYLEAKYFNSCMLIHSAKDKVVIESIPIQGQFAPVFGSCSSDFNGDHRTDFLFVGNFYSSNISQGPSDAFTGGILLSDSSSRLSVSRGAENGFYIHKDAKSLASLIMGNGQKVFIVGSNKDSLKVFSQIIQKGDHIKLDHLDSYAEVKYSDGHVEREEFYYGSGYLSQSSRFLSVSPGWQKVKIITFAGKERLISSVDRTNSSRYQNTQNR